MLATGKLHKAFCVNVKARRLQLGLTQKEVADKLGIATSQYTQIEGGRNVPTLTIVEKVADALDLPAALLVVPSESLEAVA